MKKHFVLLSLVAVFVLSAGNAFATCPTAPTLHFIGPGWYWDYTPAASCVVAYGSPTPSAVSMCGDSGWATGTGWANVSYSFQPLANKVFSTWEASAYIEFDPAGDPDSYVELWATVTHNGSTSYTLLDSHTGSDGATNCGVVTGTFSAAVGDDVTIDVYSWKDISGATVEVSRPHIYTY